MYVFKKYRFLLKNTGLWASKYRFVFPGVGMSVDDIGNGKQFVKLNSLSSCCLQTEESGL